MILLFCFAIIRLANWNEFFLKIRSDFGQSREPFTTSKRKISCRKIFTEIQIRILRQKTFWHCAGVNPVCPSGERVKVWPILVATSDQRKRFSPGKIKDFVFQKEVRAPVFQKSQKVGRFSFATILNRSITKYCNQGDFYIPKFGMVVYK